MVHYKLRWWVGSKLLDLLNQKIKRTLPSVCLSRHSPAVVRLLQVQDVPHHEGLQVLHRGLH